MTLRETGYLKVLVSSELLEAFSTRDADGNRLSVEVGEPDAEGFYTPVITRHYDDNLLTPYLDVVEAARLARCNGPLGLKPLRAALQALETLEAETNRKP